MDDLITGWRFSATMQLRTPLAVLERHGELVPDSTRPISDDAAIQHGGWIAQTRTWSELSGMDLPEFVPREMASDIGPVPVDGGPYLPFLKAVRAIVEQAPEAQRIVRLMVELDRPGWAPFVEAHGGAEKIVKKLKLGHRRTKKNKSK